MISLLKLKELTKNFCVLYVEDDLSIHATMINYLNKFFLKVLSANNGVEGLEQYKKEKFDIVITDINMPKMNGIEMLKEIKAIDENQAVLITSAHSESKFMVSAIKMGIDGYIIKPFDFDQLNHELYKISEKLKKFAENEQYKNHLQELVEQKRSEISDMLKFQIDNYEQTLISMVEMIEERDTYTAGHSKRVAMYSKMIAKEMGYSEEECVLIYQAGILHDIGKIATPDAVLLNPKNLNNIEYKLIQEHVSVSYRVLEKIPMFNSMAEIVYSHHERYDGNGYPRGLKANEVLPLARIMIVADAFDAMTTNRIYKARKTVNEALNELIRFKEKQFHPEVVDIALSLLKDVEVDEKINQFPTTRIERERFAYFYKDTLGDIYNQNYLDVVLMKNSYEQEFKYLNIFYLNHFYEYNKKYSWKEGDVLLGQFANCLGEYFKDSMVFRVFGDDFVTLCKEKINLDKLKILLDKLVEGNDVEYQIKNIDLTDVHIENIFQVENS